MVATEARSDQKTLDHAFKGLAKLNDTHDKAIKVCSIFFGLRGSDTPVLVC